MTHFTKRWSRLGLASALLGSTSLAAAAQESAEPPTLEVEAAAPATGAAETFGEAGEGRGGEAGGGAGEGGEGGVDAAAAASDPAVFRAALAITEAHVIAARDAYLAGEERAAAEMFAHPVSEVLFAMSGVFAERGVASMDDALIAASQIALEPGRDDAVVAQAAEILAALGAAGAKAPDDGSRPGAVAARVVTDQVNRAAEQYGAAVGTDAFEPYLDGYGFFKAAEAEYARHAEAIAADAPSTVADIDAAFAALAPAYPSATRPDALDADPGALLALASRLILSAQ